MHAESIVQLMVELSVELTTLAFRLPLFTLWACLITGTEFQSWLLWYSLPVLQGVLPSTYYHHYSCLVAAIGMLLGTQLTRETIDRADILLNNFCRKMSDLYGEITMIIIVFRKRYYNILFNRRHCKPNECSYVASFDFPCP
jgi:hypothetical protein